MSEEVEYRRASAIPGLILSTARYTEFSFGPHYHLDCHVALVSEGVQRQSMGGSPLFLTPGAIQLMPAGEVHDGIAGADDAPYTLRAFRIASSLLQGMGEEVTGRSSFPAQAPAVLRDPPLAGQLLRLHAALQAAPAEPLLNDVRVLTLFESLFARLLRPVPPSPAGQLSPQQLRRVRDFMDAHIAGKIVLADLAACLDLERFRFLKLFKRTVGMTPHAWLLRLRLERAMELLAAGRDLPIADVAQAVGFFDQSHFTHAFRQAYGVTPARF